MRSIQDHMTAQRALMDEPDDEQAAAWVHALALTDPSGARDALEQLTQGQPLKQRYLGEVPLADRRRRSFREEPQEGTSKAPGTRAELIATMRQAGADWMPLKAVGAGFAFTDIDDTTGIRLLMRNLDRILPVDSSLLRDRSADRLCCFEAGATIDTINRHLRGIGKALLNQPGYECLSFTGVMCSGGHGSGIRLGPLSEQVRSLRLITFSRDHELVELQVEPSNGISDPVAWQVAHPDVTLIQEDALFHATTVSAGCPGVIYSVTIEVQDAFYLREDRYLESWASIRTRVQAMLDDPALHSFHLWLSPYKTGSEQTCVVSTYRRAPGPPHGERGLGIRLGGIQPIVDIILFFARNFPRAAPGLIRASLSATTAMDVVMESPEALNFGPPNELRVDACDYGVAVERTVVAADALSAAFQEFARSERTYLLSPFGLRFVRSAAAFISPMYGRDTCMFEMPLLDRLPGRQRLLKLFFSTLAPFEARPHWGQWNDVNAARAAALFPRFADFREKVRALNPSHLFDNDFARRLEL